MVMRSVKASVKSLVQCIFAFAQRYPFAVAVFGFVSGLLSFFMVERNQELAQVIAVMMLVSWLWLASEVLLERGFSHWFGLKLPPALISFATQMVHQESLFFVIPFFFITTAWNSGQMVFTAFLIAAAFISIVDPIYYRWLAPRRWLYFIYHGVTIFAVSLTALPIIFHLPTPQSYLWSLLIALALTLPNVARSLQLIWWKRSLAVILLAVTVGSLGLLIRPWIPPATLWLTEVAITDQVNTEDRSPVNIFKTVKVEQLRQGIYAYTAIHAPRGLNERIYHVWTHNGEVIDKVALDIRGAREAGYRSWSRKENFPANPVGNWKIQVMTEARQLIGVLRFQVVEATSLPVPTSASVQSSSLLLSSVPASSVPASSVPVSSAPASSGLSSSLPSSSPAISHSPAPVEGGLVPINP
jgi:hypothetical protein